MGYGIPKHWKMGGAGFVLATSLAAGWALNPALATPAFADEAMASDYQGTLTNATAAKKDADNDNIAYVTFNDNVTAKITFLEPGIFRYNVDLSGDFSAYATPRAKSHTAKIQAQPDTSDKYSKPAATVNETKDAFEVSDGTVTLSFEKATGKMTLKRGDRVVFAEDEPLTITKSATTQSIADADADYFGGGTQNGRFIHTGKAINIKNESNWVDGGVSSPNPFYWSTAGYGVMRNTFAEGKYDFGSAVAGSVDALHKDGEFDAYYFVSDDAGTTASVAQDVLQEYYKVTGSPLLLPEYAFYVGNYNAYNRDAWSHEPKSGYKEWSIHGHESASEAAPSKRYEKGGTGQTMLANSYVESLNGTAPKDAETNENIPEGVQWSEDFSARAVVDEYQDMDMPFGYILPNDGYGCGYGQNGYQKTGGVDKDGNSSAERLQAVADNVQNLKEFSDYAKSKGVATGLWTQSNLSPDSNANTQWQTLRDFESEVKKGGVTTLKTDVAWVGSGYSFQLNGTKTAYDIVTTKNGDGTGARPNIVSLDGWAGSQRFAGLWSGDQTGGNWEYIRFHIPTFIGSGLSGNPNIGSDMDGIFGGHPLIACRDYQWKSFSSLMLDMDGWGSYAKMPYAYGDPYTGINRMYLKLKSSLLPYIYTTAASAANIDTGNGDEGLPIVRAIALSDNSDIANSTATQYEYTLGEDLLIAPVYQNTDGDSANGGLGDGNDIRNDIYLPGTFEDIWIDYWTGDQYRGGQVLNNFAAPLWKTPVFVKANAIIPMYKPNDNPSDIDRAQRDIEFFATDGENEYTLYEDDGSYVENKIDESDKEYGRESTISYGDHVSTKITSAVKDGTATFTAAKSTGGYDGYDANRTTTFVVNVSAKPSELVAKNGDKTLELNEVTSKEDFDKAEGNVYFYNEAPNLNYNATAEDEAVRNEEFSKTEITTTPKLYVKFAKTDVTKDAQTLTLKGFENKGDLPANSLNENLAAPANLAAPEDDITPTSIKLTWDAVAGATGYELELDGVLSSVGDTTTFTHANLAYNSSHTYRVRAVNADGYSAWSEPLTTKTALDPWRNVPVPVDWDFEGSEFGSGYGVKFAFDHITGADASSFVSKEANGTGLALDLDYGKVYQFEKLEFRGSKYGKGVKQMKIEASLDGTHWTDLGTHDLSGSFDKLNTVEFGGPVSARYIRMTAVQCTSYWNATEIAFYKVDGTNGAELGSINGDAVVDSADYQHLTGNCLGRENREPEAASYQTHVAKNGADFNQNGAYDVYDMAFTMSKLDGGTTKTGDVSGGIAVMPSATHVEAGDTITVDVYASDAKNVNALGALVHFKSDQFEFVKDSIEQSPYTSTMENLSIAKTEFDDGIQSVNLAFANKGDKELYDGSGVVASFKLKAVAAGDVNLDSTAWLIGPTNDSIDVVSDGTIDWPEIPGEHEEEYAQSAFNCSILNEKGEAVDVSKYIHQENFDGLFNGDVNSNDFEMEWQNASDFDTSFHKLPATLRFEFKKPSALENVVVYNRTSGNGCVTELDASIVFEDGTKQDFTFGAKQNTFELVVSQENAGKKVARVDITPKNTTTGINMLTLREIDFTYTTPGAQVAGVTIDDQTQTELYQGDLAQVFATVDCDDYPYFEVSSDKPEVASVTAVQSGEGVDWYVRGNAEGAATITVAAKADPSKTATYEVTVRAGVDVSGLQAIINEGRIYDSEAYTEASFAKLEAALKAAEDMLAQGQGSFTKNDVAQKSMDIENAIKGLKMRPIDEAKLLNKDASSGMSVASVSSYAGESPMELALDYDEDTLWHSNYGSSMRLPQYIVYDLGAEYDLTDVTFLPRQNGSLNGDIFKAQVYVADSVDELTAAADSGTLVGTFSFDNNGKTLTNRNEYQQMAFGATTTRYVKINVIESGSSDGAGNRYCSIAETRFYGEKHTDPIGDAKAELSTKVAEYEAKGLNADDYTASTWLPYANALADAKSAIEGDGLTAEQIAAVGERLDTAFAGLKKTEIPPVVDADKEKLQAVVDLVKDTDLDGKTEATAKRFGDALKAAQQALKAGEGNWKALYDELKAAYDGLADEAEVDTATLQGFVNMFDSLGMTSADFTADSWKAYADALAAAKDVLAKGDATQEQVNACTDALTSAFKGLEFKQAPAAPYKGYLQKVVANFASEGLDESRYTADSWKVYADALKAAQGVLDADDATQEQIDDATTALVEAHAGLQPAEKISFSDVDATVSHQEDIVWLAANGISKGWENADGTFSFRPFENVARADMAAFLYRMAGEPEVDAEKAPSFTDVDKDTPHYKAILWLAAEGISTGWENADGTAEFRPYAQITRADMAAFLYRMAGKPDVESPELGGFTDVDEGTVHSDAILWLAAEGISTGWEHEDGTAEFRPYAQITRADMAAFLHRMDQKGLVK